jgi:hypothetical protein
VAYGARLESVLGASPRGFESPILRHTAPREVLAQRRQAGLESPILRHTAPREVLQLGRSGHHGRALLETPGLPVAALGLGARHEVEEGLRVERLRAEHAGAAPRARGE